jgi:nucleoside recognition membrane protein YjiH
MFLGESAICLILGTLSGYPMGAKLACNLKDNNICTKYEAERLLAFTNNSGPLFIISTVRNIYVL